MQCSIALSGDQWLSVRLENARIGVLVARCSSLPACLYFVGLTLLQGCQDHVYCVNGFKDAKIAVQVGYTYVSLRSVEDCSAAGVAVPRNRLPYRAKLSMTRLIVSSVLQGCVALCRVAILFNDVDFVLRCLWA